MANYIVTGASRGIGEALVREMRSAGHKVLALARNESSLARLAEETGCSYWPFDLSRQDTEGLQRILKSWNGLDGIVHNAGTLVNKPFLELSREEVLHVYEVNVLSAFELFKTVLPFVNRGGHLVAIGSMGGLNGSVKFAGLSAYSSSKAALGVLMECLQAEFGDRDWAFNALALGAVSTEMLQQAFPGYEAPVVPEQMAAFILKFILSGHQVIRGKVLPISLSNP
jgi:3-oxoacyl-[acyl-carrier protein] reductase